MLKVTPLLFCLLIFSSTEVLAKENKDLLTSPRESSVNSHFYLGIRSGWSSVNGACSDSVIDCDDNTVGYGIYSGYQLTSWFALEGGITDYGKPGAHYSNDQVSSDIKGAELSVVFRQSFAESWSAYTRLGVSYQNIEKNSEWAGNQNEGDLNTLAALGLSYSFSKQWSLRGEYQFIDGIGGSNIQQADLHFTSLGLTYHFGGVITKTITIAPAVSIDGEALFVEMTPLKVVTENILFNHDSSTVNTKIKLDDIVKQLTEINEEEVNIVGHTDNIGSTVYNQALSERRAQFVANYLQQSGISTSKLTVSGKGESEPVSDNGSMSGRAENRRVMLRITAPFHNKKETK
ncbi:OmpA family protein [Aliivibrio sifiae]